MPKYKCTNAECPQFDKIIIDNSIIRLVQGAIVDSAETCPICGDYRAPIIEDGMTTFMHGGDNICKR